MKYNAEITGWGSEVIPLLDDKDLNFIIIFNETAPPELAEISVLHKAAPILAEIKVSDTLILCNKVFTITAIGDEALHTLKELGHCTLSFKGGSEPERPGCIMLEGEEFTSQDLIQGGTIEIF